VVGRRRCRGSAAPVTVAFADNGDQRLPDGSPGAGVDPGVRPGVRRVRDRGRPRGERLGQGPRRQRVGRPHTVVLGRRRAPVAAVAARAGGAPYDGAWTRSDVAVAWTCTDEGAGVRRPPAPVTVTSEGADQRRSGACRDQVGHVTTASTGAINIDRTPPRAPALISDRAPEDTAGGWFADRVTVSAADQGDAPLPTGQSGSGVDRASLPPSRSLTASATVAAQVRDVAGNTSPEASRDVRVDAGAPSVELVCPPSVEEGADAARDLRCPRRRCRPRHPGERDRRARHRGTR
jgi:hypothetical protein